MMSVRRRRTDGGRAQQAALSLQDGSSANVGDIVVFIRNYGGFGPPYEDVCRLGASAGGEHECRSVVI